jgi:hypothetical protein
MVAARSRRYTPCGQYLSAGSCNVLRAARSLLDLITDSRLYTQSKDYNDLLDFVVRLRNFAPFNAMLLHVEKPGLSYAASERNWQDRFERHITAIRRALVLC